MLLVPHVIFVDPSGWVIFVWRGRWGGKGREGEASMAAELVSLL